MSLNKGILLKGVFNPKLLNDLLASYFLINFDCLLFNTTPFDKKHYFFFSFLLNSRVYTFCLFLHFRQYNNIVLYLV